MRHQPVLSIAIGPKTDTDRERLCRATATLTAEDPTLRVTTDPSTGEAVIAGMGERHLEVVVDRLKREFNVEASTGRPRVAYKEALSCPADGEMQYADRAGGRGHYACVKIRIFPGDAGSGYVFENKTSGDAIPERFIPAIDEGIREALTQGVLAGYPVEDVRIELYDGSYHDRDSSEFAFKMAGSLAFRDAAKKAQPLLLEPVMRLTVTIPMEGAEEVIGDLSSHRGRIRSQEDRDGTQVITALVPLAELFGYSGYLRERTRGRGAVEMRFDRYAPCRPPDGDRGSQGSVVMAPHKPSPKFRTAGMALPEPDGEPPPTG